MALSRYQRLGTMYEDGSIRGAFPRKPLAGRYSAAKKLGKTIIAYNAGEHAPRVAKKRT